MDKKQDKDLELLLRAYQVPEPSANLAERIIDRTRPDQSAEQYEKTEQEKPGFWAVFIQNKPAMFVVPRPAMVMALVLFASAAIGFFNPADFTALELSDAGNQDLSNYIFTSEEIEERDWL